MHRLRLLLLLGLVFAVGGMPLAKAQDATSGLDQYKTVPPDTKQDKAKSKDQNNDGHRKHWWSLPHFRHKKHESESAARPAETNSSKTVAAKPMNKTAVHTHPGNRTARATGPGHKTVARTGQGKKTVAKTYPHKKVIAHTSHGKKTVRHGCTPAEAKKGGCQAYKAHSQKGTSAS